jgi:NAD(P)-dependent dehydrogenase (short-subunit alcohol dehydrogenase family)
LEVAAGAVVNIASIHATLTKPEFVAYATSKAALVGMTRDMAVELGKRVRVNAICPGAIDTDMLRAGFEGKEHEFRLLEKAHPTGSIGTPDDVAKLAVFLASPNNAFFTGGVYSIDGAIGARLHDPV